MVNKENVIAMIPARMGSTRLRRKNLALLNGRPLISYAIEAAKQSGVFNRIVVNSENKIFSEIAKRYHVEFYQRPPELATSSAKSDNVVYDFMINNPSDILVWVNPTSPLQTGEEIQKVVNYFIRERLDTLITIKNEQVHCLYNGRPLNFDTDEIFAQTQDLQPVQCLVYSVMMWRCNTFLKTFKEKGHALFCGKIGYYPVSKISAIIIKTKEDLMMAEYMLRALQHNKVYEVRYDELTERI